MRLSVGAGFATVVFLVLAALDAAGSDPVAARLPIAPGSASGAKAGGRVPPAAAATAERAARVSFRAAPDREPTRRMLDVELGSEVLPAAPPPGGTAPVPVALRALVTRDAGAQDAVAPATTRADKALPWTGAARLADPAHTDDQYVSLAMSPVTGYLYAVFESYDLASTDRDIHIARSTDQGLTWTAWELPSFTLDEFMPDIAIDAAGWLHVAWVRSDGVVVRARSQSPDTPTAWGSVRGLTTGSTCATPSIAVSGAGDFARVFIACSVVDYGEWTLLWMWSTNGGATVAYDFLYADGYPDLWPDCALDGATAYLVNGEQNPDTGEIEILIARDALSGTFASVTNLTAWTAMSCGFPSLAAQGSDVFCVYQLDWDDGLGNVDGDVIYHFSWDALDTVYGPYELVADPRECVGPQVFARDGLVGALWLEAPAHGDEFRLVARTAGGYGHPDAWRGEEVVNDLATVTPSFRAVAGAVAGAGAGVTLQAAWSDTRDHPTQGLNVYGARRPTRPNLAPFAPEGWSGPLVAATDPGQRAAAPAVAAGDTCWISLAFWNDGLAGTTQDVVLRLTLDGATVAAWALPGGLPASTYATVEDHPLVLAAGVHEVGLTLDPEGAIAEEDESDNGAALEVFATTQGPRLRLSTGHVTHAFPAPPIAKVTRDALVDDPPLVAQAYLPVVAPELADALATASPVEMLPVVIVPTERVDTAELVRRLVPAGAAPAAPPGLGVRDAVMEALKKAGSKKKDKLERAHRLLVLRGLMAAPESQWIDGTLRARATPAAIGELALDPDVARIWLDDRACAPAGGGAAAEMAEDKALAWHLGRVGADAAWALGYDGSGVIVAHLDSGVNYNHPDLAGRMWDGAPHHGWDCLDEDDDPMDGDTSVWHGTHTAGLVVGDGAGGTTTGAAPGARLMALRCVPGYYQDLVEAVQYALDHGADLISFSAGWMNASDDLRAALRSMAEALLAAQVPWICAAGNGDNSGSHFPAPRDVVSPGDCPGPAYGAAGRSAVITVGATDAADAVVASSSRGPTAWALAGVPAYADYPYPPGLIKPDLAAPGAAVTSTVGATGYAAYTGTSMSTPLVTGAAAILLQARPLLSPPELAAALEGGALDLGAPGRDNDTGAGRLDVVAALALLPDSAIDRFWIRNDGPLPLRVTGMTWTMPWLGVAPLTATIAPGDSARFTATFDPAFLPAGTHYDEIVIVSNDPRSPHRLAAVASLGSDATTGVGEGPAPRAAAALTGAPNPFNPRTVLRFALTRAGRARLAVYGPDGRRVRALLDGPLPVGENAAVWDGRDDAGRPLASGLYVARLEAPGEPPATRKLILVR